jgi:hypothetical protein
VIGHLLVLVVLTEKAKNFGFAGRKPPGAVGEKRFAGKLRQHQAGSPHLTGTDALHHFSPRFSGGFLSEHSCTTGAKQSQKVLIARVGGQSDNLHPAGTGKIKQLIPVELLDKTTLGDENRRSKATAHGHDLISNGGASQEHQIRDPMERLLYSFPGEIGQSRANDHWSPPAR